MTAPKYHLTSYGCQMNKLDSELVESKLRQRGYQPASSEADASVVLLNTCSVRQHAEDRVWSKLGKLRVRKRTDPGLVVGVLGCMAQEHKRYLLARMPHVDLVVGPSAFGDIDDTVESARVRNLQIAAEREPARTKHEVAGAGVVSVDQGKSGDTIRRDVRVRPHRSQAFVSVMRGCNMPCTYCIVPTTRGDEVSRPIQDLVEEAQRLCDDGVTEITLLGQTVNAYGRDLTGQVHGTDRVQVAMVDGARKDVLAEAELPHPTQPLEQRRVDDAQLALAHRHSTVDRVAQLDHQTL